MQDPASRLDLARVTLIRKAGSQGIRTVSLRPKGKELLGALSRDLGWMTNLLHTGPSKEMEKALCFLETIYGQVGGKELENPVTRRIATTTALEFAREGWSEQDMLNRFKYDLELLAPKVMVLCAGTNDIAQNDGKFVSNEEILANIKTMVERAAAVGTKTILCSLLPADKYYWSNAIENPSQEIKKVNELIKAYAAENNIPYVDYWTPLHSETDGMPAKYSADGVHPNKHVFEQMSKYTVGILKSRYER
jgi:lysophospholipase L1-like esterase